MEGNFKIHLKKLYVRLWSDWNASGHGQMAGFCEHGSEHSGSKQAGNFFSSVATINFLENSHQYRVS